MEDKPKSAASVRESTAQHGAELCVSRHPSASPRRHHAVSHLMFFLCKNTMLGWLEAHARTRGEVRAGTGVASSFPGSGLGLFSSCPSLLSVCSQFCFGSLMFLLCSEIVLNDVTNLRNLPLSCSPAHPCRVFRELSSGSPVHCSREAIPRQHHAAFCSQQHPLHGSGT